MKILETTDAVTIEPQTANAAVIWLHGLGADGHDFVPIVEELNYTNKTQTRFIFPHAPMRPVTVNGGYVMRAWYDIVAIDRSARQDLAGIQTSVQRVEQIIAAESAQGIKTQRIVIAGFSQGGSIALYTGLRHQHRLAGLMGLSSWLPLSNTLASEMNSANAHTPIFMAHGTDDPIVTLQIAEHSRSIMQELDCRIEWHTYPMPHSVCQEEILDISQWLERVLP